MTTSMKKICFMCRRLRASGKMISLPNNINICTECMQKSFDTMSSSNINYNDLMNNIPNMPNISMIDLSTLQDRIPKKQKLEKEKGKAKGRGDAKDTQYKRHTCSP